MLTAEERRQRILANSESRLAKLRHINQHDNSSDIPPMASISSPAPHELLRKPNEEFNSSINSSVNNNQSQQTSSSSSLFSTITTATNMLNSFTSSSTTTTKTVENTKEMIVIDKQHILMFILGIIVGILYSFYISIESNFFFLVFFTCCICILTSRYYSMQMKHRTNVLITTAMLSGFKPDFMQKLSLVYTLVCDAWIIFAFYFVSFCLTYVVCSSF
ncbi:unnamed protein product [Rotaria sordida]|uniref:Uncharacterized protein n=1 Tax=Rotaria sordida TaxID=392033 RepID=A0A814W7E3_9BILA|nr:unnamed protein product [Rotaria sordida]